MSKQFFKKNRSELVVEWQLVASKNSSSCWRSILHSFCNDIVKSLRDLHAFGILPHSERIALKFMIPCCSIAGLLVGSVRAKLLVSSPILQWCGEGLEAQAAPAKAIIFDFVR